MDDREFFDTIYAHWAKTTGAKDQYWMPETTDENQIDVWAVGEEGDRYLIASDLESEDADFITAVHGCFPDLIRALHTAFDEADRAIHERDSQECRIAELELELDEIKNYVSEEEER